MMKQAIVVFGGSGVCGKRVVREILRLCKAQVTIAARDRARAEAVRNSLGPDRIDLKFGDARDTTFVRESIRGATAAVCCLGPFHAVDLTILEACIAERVHYIDIAENREYVRRVYSLDSKIKAAGIVALTGHSSLPGSSSVLAKLAADGMKTVDEVLVGLFIGNKNERGAGGIGALLNSLGERFAGWENGRPTCEIGWQRKLSFDFPSPVGERDLYLSNIADYDLMPRLLGSTSVRFFVGFESRLMNRMISLAGRLKRMGFLPAGPGTARVLVKLGGLFSFTGYDGGALQVTVTGEDRHGKATRSTIALMADREGQRIPAMPAALAACALVKGEPIEAGVKFFGEWMNPERYVEELLLAGFRVDRGQS
ncbi:MAG: saccharopine dehydrogenase NADP-binding domain-containing protein [Nitrospirae bacterium]|nr:saccharopine dehydrogenase NADP-binding domain-containing protein [Nitrospirota bacterium]